MQRPAISIQRTTNDAKPTNNSLRKSAMENKSDTRIFMRWRVGSGSGACRWISRGVWHAAGRVGDKLSTCARLLGCRCSHPTQCKTARQAQQSTPVCCQLHRQEAGPRPKWAIAIPPNTCVMSDLHRRAASSAAQTGNTVVGNCASKPPSHRLVSDCRHTPRHAGTAALAGLLTASLSFALSDCHCDGGCTRKRSSVVTTSAELAVDFGVCA